MKNLDLLKAAFLETRKAFEAAREEYLEAFLAAQDLKVGDTIEASKYGKTLTLRVTRLFAAERFRADGTLELNGYAYPLKKNGETSTINGERLEWMRHGGYKKIQAGGGK